jgi:hypothetical protein
MELTLKEFCSKGGKARAAKIRAEKRAKADARRAEEAKAPPWDQTDLMAKKRAEAKAKKEIK